MSKLRVGVALFIVAVWAALNVVDAATRDYSMPEFVNGPMMAAVGYLLVGEGIRVIRKNGVE